MSILLAIGALLFNQLSAPDPIEPEDRSVRVDSIYYFKGNLLLDSLQNNSDFYRFLPVSESDKFVDQNWLCFKLINPNSAAQSIVLEIESSVFLDFLELYQKADDKLISLGITGDPIHHSLRPMKEHGLLFPVTLLPNSKGTYFLFSKSSVPYVLPLSIYTKQAFDKAHNLNNLLYVFYYGFIVFVLLFSIFLSVIFRADLSFLHPLFTWTVVFIFTSKWFRLRISVAQLAGV